MAIASKDRTAMFGNMSLFLTPKVGKQMKDWLNNGAVNVNAAPEPKTQNDAPAPAPVKTRTSRKKEQPQPPEAPPIASQEEPEGGIIEPDNDQTLSSDQRGQIRDYLAQYKIDTIAFLTWAKSRYLVATDSADFGIEDIRADQFDYLVSLFEHERSRNQFIQHLNAMKKTA
jgi:hypothetical protein